MNDIRRTILWVIFGFSLVLLWDQWQVHNGHQATFFPQSKPAATAKAPQGGASVPSAVPASAATPGGAGAVVPPGSAAPGTTQAAPRELITVATDTMRVTFDSEGGSVVRTELLKVSADSTTKKGTSTFVLLNETAQSVFVAQSGLIGGDFPNHKTVMAVSGDRELKPGADQLSVRFESPEKGGVKLVKTYTLKRGAYTFDVKHEVVNIGTAPVAPQLYVQLVRGATTSGGSFITNPTGTFTGPAVYTEAHKYQKVEFSDIDKNKADFQKEATTGWVAMVQHYFASAWILPDGVKRENFVRKVDDTLYAVGSIAPLQSLAPGATQAVQATLFTGPQEEKMLEQRGARAGPGEGLRHLHHPRQAAVLAAGQAALGDRQLGLVDHGAGAADQDRLLLAAGQGLPEHGQDEGHQPARDGHARALQGQPAADAAGDDAHLPRGEGQPDRRLPARSWCRSRCSSRCTGCCCPAWKCATRRGSAGSATCRRPTRTSSCRP